MGLSRWGDAIKGGGFEQLALESDGPAGSSAFLPSWGASILENFRAYAGKDPTPQQLRDYTYLIAQVGPASVVEEIRRAAAAGEFGPPAAVAMLSDVAYTGGAPLAVEEVARRLDATDVFGPDGNIAPVVLVDPKKVLKAYKACARPLAALFAGADAGDSNCRQALERLLER